LERLVWDTLGCLLERLVWDTLVWNTPVWDNPVLASRLAVVGAR